MHWNSLLAQATGPTSPPVAPGAPPSWMQFAPMVLLVIVFYFILIRPQQKRAKTLAALVSNIKSGDKVMTSSGIIGVVITVKDKTISLRSADAKMEVSKASVTEILEPSTPTEA